MPQSAADYRKRVLAAYPKEFDIHREVAATLEAAIISNPRTYPTLVHLVIDMLMLQSMKSHSTISLLAQHGLQEDTATITRRLLELSVQAAYIGSESDDGERRRRAGRYLAFLWRQLPRRIKLRLPTQVRRQWISIGRGYGRFVRNGATRWGPNFRSMFTAIGSEDLYLTDYALLSSIAHGAEDSQVFQFSSTRVRLHTHQFVPILLVYGSRYYLVTATQWIQLFGLVDDTTFRALTKKVLEWRHTPVTD